MRATQTHRGCVLVFVVLQALVLTSAPAKTLLLDDSDNDSRFCTNVGDRIIVKLSSNPSTGYSWGKPRVISQLELVSATFESDPSSRPGAPGLQVFTWKTKNTGKVTIDLNYFRPFEKDTPPAKRYRLSVNIEARSSAKAEATEQP